jgi:hypothetical protein
MRRTIVPIAIALLLPSLSADRIIAALAYTAHGSTYTQTFNTLPVSPVNSSLVASGQEWQDDTTTPAAGHVSIPGWYLYHPLIPTGGEEGFNGHQRLRVGGTTAGQTTGAFYSFGENTPVSSNERALGAIPSTTIATNAAPTNELFFGLRLTNATGMTLSEFTIGYTGEQWREAATPTVPNQTITLDYRLGGTAIEDGGFTELAGPATTFNSPTDGSASGGSVNGNNAAFRTTGLGTTVTGITWAPSTDLWIRWTQIQNGGNDHGLAIDDVTFSAVPEPSAVLFGAVVCGVLGVTWAGRRWLAQRKALTVDMP